MDLKKKKKKGCLSEAEILILSFVHNTKLESDPSLVNHLKWPNKPCEVPELSCLARDKILSDKRLLSSSSVTALSQLA